MATADQCADELDKFVERMIIKLTLDVLRNIQKATPVDTGWARANWVPSLNRPVTRMIAKRNPNKLKKNRGKDGQRPPVIPARSIAVAAGVDQVLRYRFAPGAKVWISNNVKYITILNSTATPSKKAPAAFVQIAIKQAILALDNEVGGSR